jgi:hypothetical protein
MRNPVKYKLRTSVLSSAVDDDCVVLLSAGFQLPSESDVYEVVSLSSSSVPECSEKPDPESSKSSASVYSDPSPVATSASLNSYSSQLLEGVPLHRDVVLSNFTSPLLPLALVHSEHCDGVFISPVTSAVSASNSAFLF